MVLNINCMRDLLLSLEEWLVLSNDLEYNFLDLHDLRQIARLQKYKIPVIVYTISKLEEAGFIQAEMQFSDNKISSLAIGSITYDGHQFLDLIRSESTWDKIKAICDKTNLKSVSAIMEIADAILPETIRAALHES